MLYSGATGMTPNNVSLPDSGGRGPDTSTAKQPFYCCGELTPTRRRAAASERWRNPVNTSRPGGIESWVMIRPIAPRW